ncbi:MAG: Hpt domain-containing protein [Chlorobi bacterium]|nr:Hpt domain-containing protein [Chlorobiota bacterium]
MGKIYSTDKILVYVGNDENQVAEMMELFLRTIPAELEKLENEIICGNWKKASEISHRIKPSMEILQIENASGEFMELHTKLHQEIDLETIKPLYENIKLNSFKAIAQIKEDYHK